MLRRVSVAAVGLVLGCTEEIAPAEPPVGPTGCALGERVVESACIPAGVQDNGCPAGEHGQDGVCQPAGILPGGCGEGFVHDGDRGCAPVLPEAPCDPGLMAVPGDAACREIASCGTSTWDDIPLNGPTVFVDQSHVGASDGSMAQPFVVLQDAIDAASDGDVIAIAAGSYAGVSVGKQLTLWGRCPELVSVTDPVAALTIASAASGALVRELALTGAGAGVVVASAADVALEALWIHDTGGRGLDVSQSASVTLRGSLIESASSRGVYAEGATVVLEAIHVRGTRALAPEIGGRGINLRDDPATSMPTTAELSLVHVEENSEVGIVVHASSATISDSVARNTQPADNGRFGRGLVAQMDPETGQPADLEVRRSAILDNIDAGVSVTGSTLVMENTVVANTAVDVDGSFGWGVVAQGHPPTGLRSSVTATASLIDGSHTGGVMIGASVAELTRLVVRGTEPASGFAGRGVLAQSDADNDVPVELTLRSSVVEDNYESGVLVDGGTAIIDGVLVRGSQTLNRRAGYGITIQNSEDGPADAVLHACLVEDNHEAGILITASRVELTGVAIRRTIPNDDGYWGMGIMVQRQQFSGARAEVDIGWSAIADNQTVGLFIVGSDAVLHESLVTNTGSQPADLAFGDGVAASAQPSNPASLLATDTLVTGSARAGFGAFGAAVRIGGARIECNTIDLDGETLFGDFTFEDLGDNVCGCGDVKRTCKAVSSMLLAPEPLPPPAQ